MKRNTGNTESQSPRAYEDQPLPELTDEDGQSGAEVGAQADPVTYARQMAARRRLELLWEKKRLKDLLGDELADEDFG